MLKKKEKGDKGQGKEKGARETTKQRKTVGGHQKCIKRKAKTRQGKKKRKKEKMEKTRRRDKEI